GVKVQQENVTLATITFQNFFRLYDKLAGMTGTAITEAEEFHKIYKLEVDPIPTHMPMVRDDQSDLIFKTEAGKFRAVVDEIEERTKNGQPILVGTTSIEKSERLARLLEKRGIDHSVLNAKLHEKEAAIIANAGQRASVTIATNMAGRGTDIVLGEGVTDAGGLYIIGTERHESRRIDNQLRGRSGRQGDPGESRFFLSFEDDLMRVFGGERMQGIMDRLRVDEDTPLESRMVSRQLESAQSRVEGHNFDSRRHVVEYDVAETITGELTALYEEKEQEYGAELLRQVEQSLMLQVIDNRWRAYLTQMDHLREGIGLQAYGQKDPLIEYKQAAFESFQDLTEDMQREIVRMLLNVQIRRVEPAAADGQPPSEAAAQAAAPASPRADRPGAVTNGEQVPPARPAAAAASGALARVTTPARAGLPLPAQPAVRNIVESSSAGTRRADGAASGARAM